jgi:hypothetical protein
MSIKGRMTKLERETGIKDGVCPGCRLRPGDIRTIVIASHPIYKPGEPVLPFYQIVCGDMHQPGRPRCGVCGGYMPPVATVVLPDQDLERAAETEP